MDYSHPEASAETKETSGINLSTSSLNEMSYRVILSPSQVPLYETCTQCGHPNTTKSNWCSICHFFLVGYESPINTPRGFTDPLPVSKHLERVQAPVLIEEKKSTSFDTVGSLSGDDPAYNRQISVTTDSRFSECPYLFSHFYAHTTHSDTDIKRPEPSFEKRTQLVADSSSHTSYGCSPIFQFDGFSNSLPSTSDSPPNIRELIASDSSAPFPPRSIEPFIRDQDFLPNESMTGMDALLSIRQRCISGPIGDGLCTESPCIVSQSFANLSFSAPQFIESDYQNSKNMICLLQFAKQQNYANCDTSNFVSDHTFPLNSSPGVFSNQCSVQPNCNTYFVSERNTVEKPINKMPSKENLPNHRVMPRRKYPSENLAVPALARKPECAFYSKERSFHRSASGFRSAGLLQPSFQMMPRDNINQQNSNKYSRHWNSASTAWSAHDPASLNKRPAPSVKTFHSKTIVHRPMAASNFEEQKMSHEFSQNFKALPSEAYVFHRNYHHQKPYTDLSGSLSSGRDLDFKRKNKDLENSNCILSSQYCASGPVAYPNNFSPGIVVPRTQDSLSGLFASGHFLSVFNPRANANDRRCNVKRKPSRRQLNQSQNTKPHSTDNSFYRSGSDNHIHDKVA
ncbi:unnamed protein product [Protopolystoma xenopodis]|uniref:Uncharacterized protein n=1 Tax=Protopolystoma xenopodis TaxID=117903 RepID=A0A3S4ZRJ5_9PLAT|nr:unnamed protein product [Protopolystoma xenopodis]